MAQAKTAAKPAKGAGHAVSPLAPKTFPSLPPLAGVRLSTGEAGVRYKDRTDVLLAVFSPGTQVAGVFTKSKTASAPVDWCKTSLAGGGARALVVNSGNANAFTGKAGFDGARQVAESAAAIVGCKPGEVFLASTGVIGEPLPAGRITKILGTLAEEGAAGGWRAAAEAIMTTDTYPKLATRVGDHRRQAGDDQRHRQGLGDDRARHGDHAVLRLHRRDPAGAGAAGIAWQPASSLRSTPSPSTATHPPATRCCCSRPARAPAIPRSRKRTTSG
ncbi:MAG: bifunctional ornithine acetyltransferase/N-acetylglutamate synthase [Rhizomicrobium sp.]